MSCQEQLQQQSDDYENQISQQNSDQQDKNKQHRDNLLKQQQATTDKINSLLQMASQITCDAECQRQKTESQLKDKYLGSITNVATAPAQVNEARKRYYVFVNGESAYNDLIEKELKEKAQRLTDLILDEFNEEAKRVMTMNNYLNNDLNSMANTQELYDKYKTENDALKHQIDTHHSDTLTNDRKTYYESQENDVLRSWYRVLLFIFYVFVLGYLLGMLFSPSKLGNGPKLVIFLFLVLYPFYIDYLFAFISKTYNNIVAMFPTNAYKNL